MQYGSGNNGEYTFSDIIDILSFFLALKNLDLNVDQNYMQDVEQKFNNQMSSVVDEIHKHLQIQDDKIDEILLILNQLKEENNFDQ